VYVQFCVIPQKDKNVFDLEYDKNKNKYAAGSKEITRYKWNLYRMLINFKKTEKNSVDVMLYPIGTLTKKK
jgi:hypothetical protein